jgi:hypothetical protein
MATPTAEQVQAKLREIRARNATAATAPPQTGSPTTTTTNLPDAAAVQAKLKEIRAKNAGAPAPAPVSAPTTQLAPPPQKPGAYDISNPEMGMNVAKQAVEGGKGFLKGIGSTLLGIGEVGSRALESGYNATVGKLTGKKAVDGADAIHEIRESDKFRPTNTAQKVGFGAEQVAEFFIPGGVAAKAVKVTEIAAKASKLPRFLKAAAGLTKDVAESSLVTAAQSGGDLDTIKENAKTTAALGGTLRGAGLLKEVVGKGMSGRLVNSLIKPSKLQFAFGKNPGNAVAKEGIVATNLEDLGQKILEKRTEAGSAIGTITSSPKYATVKIDASDAFAPLDDAIAQAEKNPRTNSAIINRLKDIKADLLKESVDETGKVAYGRPLRGLSLEDTIKTKQEVGELTKFTGNPSDDQLVNSALQRVYRSLRVKTEAVAPELKTANERWGNLLAAEKAVEARRGVIERQNMISLPGAVAGSGAAIATALLSGGSAVPTILAGAGIIGIQKAFASPLAKTGIAKWLAKATTAEKQQLYRAVPKLYDLFKTEFGASAD